MVRLVRVVILIISFGGCAASETELVSENDFKDIMTGIAGGWNEGNAASAIQYFADDAVYEEPPKKQLYKGRREIFEFFGGENGFDLPMKMKWHNLAFNEKDQVGFGEYTFAMNNQYHGIVVVRFAKGKIVRWREYQYKSELPWDDFAAESFFKTVEMSEL